MNEVSQSIAVTEDQVKRAHNFKDLTGQRFGNLLVVDLAPKIKPKVTRWNCICDCGSLVAIEATKMLSGNTKSCGCYKRASETARGVDLTGRRYGKLHVISLASNGSHNTSRKWLCRCDCGNERIIIGKSLTGGKTSSCGCNGSRTRIGARSTKHGMAQRGKQTRTYKIWTDVIKRATNPNHWAWNRYGGRGLGIHEAWKDFAVFHADVGDIPDGLSIDRIDNDKGYEPGNIRFATRLEQANNRHDNVKIEWRGKIYTLTELSQETGIKRNRIRGWNDGGQDVARRVEESLCSA